MNKFVLLFLILPFTACTETNVKAENGVEQNRIKVAEAVSLLSEAKTPLVEQYAVEGITFLMASFTELGIKTSGKYTKSIVATTDFALQATMKYDGSEIAGKTIRSAYNTVTGDWSCGSGSPNGVDVKYLPLGCR